MTLNGIIVSKARTKHGFKDFHNNKVMKKLPEDLEEILSVLRT